MNQRLIILFLLTFFSCSEKTETLTSKEEEFNLKERQSDIDEIFETIIASDSSFYEVKVLSSIVKLNILTNKTDYLDENDQFQLLDYNDENEIPQILLYNPEDPNNFFEEKDLEYIISQNSNPDTIYFNPDRFKKLNFISSNELSNHLKAGGFNYPSFVIFNIPIFSGTNTTVMVQEAFHCGGMCGGGKKYILRKVNNKWVIVDSWRTWIS